VKAAARIPIYQHSAIVAKFLLFCATNDAVADENEPALIKRGRPGIAPLFKLANWQNENYYTVEHIAPRKRSDKWPSIFFDDPDLVHRLGNLILLPQEANSLISDRAWIHKRLFYKLLSAQTVPEQDTIKAELQAIGITLSKTAEDIIKTADTIKPAKRLSKFLEIGRPI
jgi:hypothetical protein